MAKSQKDMSMSISPQTDLQPNQTGLYYQRSFNTDSQTKRTTKKGNHEKTIMISTIWIGPIANGHCQPSPPIWYHSIYVNWRSNIKSLIIEMEWKLRKEEPTCQERLTLTTKASLANQSWWAQGSHAHQSGINDEDMIKLDIDMKRDQAGSDSKCITSFANITHQKSGHLSTTRYYGLMYKLKTTVQCPFYTPFKFMASDIQNCSWPATATPAAIINQNRLLICWPTQRAHQLVRHWGIEKQEANQWLH